MDRRNPSHPKQQNKWEKQFGMGETVYLILETSYNIDKTPALFEKPET